MKIIDILKEMKAKGFTDEAKIDFSFKDGTVARCSFGDFFSLEKERPEMYSDMSGNLTTYYNVDEMLSMNCISIDDVEIRIRRPARAGGIMMKLNKYLFVIAYALAAALDDSSFATENGSNYDYWKIERIGPGGTSLKLWHKNDYPDEKWSFCGQFDLANQKYYAHSEFEDEEDWL